MKIMRSENFERKQSCLAVEVDPRKNGNEEKSGAENRTIKYSSQEEDIVSFLKTISFDFMQKPLL